MCVYVGACVYKCVQQTGLQACFLNLFVTHPEAGNGVSGKMAHH